MYNGEVVNVWNIIETLKMMHVELQDKSWFASPAPNNSIRCGGMVFRRKTYGQKGTLSCPFYMQIHSPQIWNQSKLLKLVLYPLKLLKLVVRVYPLKLLKLDYVVCLKSRCTDFLFKCLLDSPETTSYLLQIMTFGKLHNGSNVFSTDHSRTGSYFL